MTKSMIRWLIVSAAVMAAGCASRGGEMTEIERQTIRREVLATDAEMVRAAESLDVEKFSTFIAEGDDTRILQNGALMTRTEALRGSKESMQAFSSLQYEFTDRHVTVLSREAAVLTARGKSTAILADGRRAQQEFVESLAFGWRNGQWRLLVGHLSIPATSNAPVDKK